MQSEHLLPAFFRLRLAPILASPTAGLTRLQPDPLVGDRSAAVSSGGEQLAASHNPFAAQLGYLLMLDSSDFSEQSNHRWT